MDAIAYFGMPGGSEVLLILGIVLLLFGAKKLPDLSRALGKSLGEFKKGKEELEREIRDIKSSASEPLATPDPEASTEEDRGKSENRGGNRNGIGTTHG